MVTYGRGRIGVFESCVEPRVSRLEFADDSNKMKIGSNALRMHPGALLGRGDPETKLKASTKD